MKSCNTIHKFWFEKLSGIALSLCPLRHPQFVALPTVPCIPQAETKCQKTCNFTFAQLGVFYICFFCYCLSYPKIVPFLIYLAPVGSWGTHYRWAFKPKPWISNCERKTPQPTAPDSCGHCLLNISTSLTPQIKFNKPKTYFPINSPSSPLSLSLNDTTNQAVKQSRDPRVTLNTFSHCLHSLSNQFQHVGPSGIAPTPPLPSIPVYTCLYQASITSHWFCGKQCPKTLPTSRLTPLIIHSKWSQSRSGQTQPNSFTPFLTSQWALLPSTC